VAVSVAEEADPKRMSSRYIWLMDILFFEVRHLEEMLQQSGF
jgi:hypothetical protein